MRITVLGCGSSGGVPLIGNVWGTCDPHNPLNRRTRASILVEDGTTTVLVDTSPDMRQQLLACGLKTLDAVLFTHAHADHCHGIDELRSVNWLTQKPIDMYADAATMSALKSKFGYIFTGAAKGDFFKPSAAPHEISGAFAVGSITVLPFYQDHGPIRSMGFRFSQTAPKPLGEGGDDLAYSTDVHHFDAEALAALHGVKTWILDCVRIKSHPTHLNLDQTLGWIEKVRPERAFLTHMNHEMDYETLVGRLPKGVLPAYDGMVIECA